VSGFELTQTAAQLALAHAGRTSNSSAHDSLMVARWYAEQRTPHGLTRAITLYNEAIRLDSSYADAWAGLASALNLRGVFEDSASVPYFAKGESIVLHALALDSNSALAHTEYGFTKVFYDRDYAGAQAEFARALALDSMQSATWLFRGWAYLGEDKVDLALRSMRHGWQIDPASLIVGTRLGTVLYFADSMQAAEQQLRAVLKLDKNFTFAGIQLAQVYADQHQCSEALRVLPETPLPFGSPDDLNRVYTWARCNDLPRAQGYLDTLEMHARSGGYANPFFVAIIYAALQSEAGMYRWLNAAVAQDNWALFELRRHPAFRPYRSEPAFQALLREAQAQSARRRELSMSFLGVKFRSGS
jgi:tetratricopeptide (TPR) repeat protein